MITVEEKTNADPQWNERLLNSKIGTIAQTKEFGSFKQLDSGANPLFLKFINSKGKIVGQLLTLLYSRSEKKNSISKIIGKIYPHRTFCKWVYGPIIFDPNFTNEIISALYDFLKINKFTVWGSNHPLSDVLFTPKDSFKIDNWATFLLDLRQDRDTILKNMHKKSARKNIERSIARNVEIKEINKTDLKTYHRLSLETKQESNTSLSLMEKQWDMLNPVGYTGFLAYENANPIGGIKISSFNGYVMEFSIVRSKQDTTAKLYAQDLLKWKILEWGIQNKFNYYDFMGVNPYSKNKKEEGIYRYKQKWGGTLYKYNIIKS